MSLSSSPRRGVGSDARRASERRWRFPVAALAMLGAVAAATGACDTPRTSALGESCQSTSDCADPLRCVAFVCVSSDGGAGGAGSTTLSSSDASSDAASTTASQVSSSQSSSTESSSTGTILDPTLCAMCLEDKCSAPLAACGDECYSVEACIEATCKGLVENALPDEGMCQVHCQNEHPTGKQPHLAMVNCSQTAPCGPCSSNPFDYDDCRSKADVGPCQSLRQACTDSTDCTDYRLCTITCTTFATCLQCQAGTSGQAGFALQTAYERCVAEECLAESWLP